MAKLAFIIVWLMNLRSAYEILLLFFVFLMSFTYLLKIIPISQMLSNITMCISAH